MASTNTRRFFQKLRLEEGFLDADPATWLELEDYQTAAAFVQRIAVINDTQNEVLPYPGIQQKANSG
ncbi:Uncharacterized protein FKW44_010701 [Caligus rogercresseyi]|uniref:Uncharacterized protein n=1 Tax=Caligus rogercresseyi TaxID=217165 RepID=A0A7T8K8C4_CALRO|nr:Uncharacterized protein FKW44_010701 [Caligus rogercresseyi]